MAKRGGDGLQPSSPRLPSQQPYNPETPARAKNSSHPSPSPVFRQVKLHATPGEAHVRGQRGCSVGKGKVSGQPTPPTTPHASHRDVPPRSPRLPPTEKETSEDRDLSPHSTAAAMSTVGGGSQYEASTAASSDMFSGTKILLKATEMIHGEVRSSESRLTVLVESEREAREFSCRQLRQDVEAMVTIVESLSSQMHKAPLVDSRLDAFLEQEKRARDVLREDVEGLADQISALDDDRQREMQSGASAVDSASQDMLEKERDARQLATDELRRDLEAHSNQERSARDLSNAVLRKDFSVFRKELEALAANVRNLPTSQLAEIRLNETLEQDRRVLDGTCAELRQDFDALSAVVRSIRSDALAADVASKCTGGTGNSEDRIASNNLCNLCEGVISPAAKLEVHDPAGHRLLQQQKEEVVQVEALTVQLRMDLASSTQVVHLRLEKIDQAITDLQWDMRASQALERCLVDRINLAPERK